MSDHPSVERIRSLLRAFKNRDVETIQQAFAEDATWHFPGKRGRLAGSHSGYAAIFSFLARVTELTDGTFDFKIERVLADDDYAVVFFRGHAHRNGLTLDNPTCLKIRLREGRAVEIWEFVWDLDAVEDFWV